MSVNVIFFILFYYYFFIIKVLCEQTRELTGDSHDFLDHV